LPHPAEIAGESCRLGPLCPVPGRQGAGRRHGGIDVIERAGHAMNDLDTSFLERPEIQPDRIHLLCFRLEQPFAGALQLLDSGERARAERLVFERDRRRFIAAHAWLRVALGRCVDRPPESLQFATGTRGKPRLVHSAIDLRFNLSHAGERALLAITIGLEVGVDIEEERPIDVMDLARRFFSSPESDALEALPRAEQVPAFFRCWTRKEAFIKALGDGFSFPLDGFEVSLAEDPAPPLLRSCSADPAQLDNWRIVSLPTDPGYAAAVAATAGDWCIVRRNAGAWHPQRFTSASGRR
jgi:4'-phosphopantetheinyl transferase